MKCNHQEQQDLNNIYKNQKMNHGIKNQYIG